MHLAVLDESQPSGPFGDQGPPGVHPVDAPRNHQPLRPNIHLDVVIERLKLLGRRRRLGPGLLLGITQKVDDLVDLLIGQRLLIGRHSQMRNAVLDVANDVAAIRTELPDARRRGSAHCRPGASRRDTRRISACTDHVQRVPSRGNRARRTAPPKNNQEDKARLSHDEVPFTSVRSQRRSQYRSHTSTVRIGDVILRSGTAAVRCE